MTYKRFISIVSFLLLFALNIASIKPAIAAANVWDVVRDQFQLDHEVNKPEVQRQLRWILSQPTYVQELIKAQPYIYHIVTEIKKRNLPGEIALMPMIESAFNPFAYSGSGAAGLWQLMPETGSDLGLKQDWWSDDRRHVFLSTNAALKYLTYLNRYFHGNWLLAFAAYDSGEGTVARAIRNRYKALTPKASFWTLHVPTETKLYVPRLLALAEIIQHPQRYHVKLPYIPHEPYFKEVQVGSQIDLSYAAKLAGISYHDLIKLNPSHNRWATSPHRPYNLLIPKRHAEEFCKKLAMLPVERRISLKKHTVSKGDSLGSIARRYHTTINLVKQLNQLHSENIKVNQTILIPDKKQLVQIATQNTMIAAPVQHFKPLKNHKVIHIVQENESLASVQQKYAISQQALLTWNRLDESATLKKGQQLTIWKPSKSTGTYKVKAGDSLGQIAQVHHTSVKQLISLNPKIQKNAHLRVGQEIALG